jgi:DNA-binding NarL/FixJ family response regulator
MENPILWLIDENVDQLLTYRTELQHLLPDSIRVEALLALPRKEDYIDRVLSHPNTACILIDQKLKDTGVANYLGIELAKTLRAVNSKIPIYILTNWAKERDQFIGGEWSVEDIIPKDDLVDDAKAKIVISRILRRMDVYADLLGDRERRFNDLLRKSLTEELSSEEKGELESLQFERSAAILATETGQLDELDRLVDRYKSLLQEFRMSSVDGIPGIDAEARDAGK